MNITNIGGRSCTIYADDTPSVLLIQPADKREAETLDKEIAHIKSLTVMSFVFAAFEISDWNSELSPWEAPPVFGKEPFGKGADSTLAYIEETLIPNLQERFSLNSDIPVVLGGYSLAGLFALWSGYTSDRFTAIAAASPSVWFQGWSEFTDNHSPAPNRIYLSLGKKEERTRNNVMAAVGDNIRRQYDKLKTQGVDVALDWNEGNHFTEPEIRTAKGFAWCIDTKFI
ncbi:alpha/beta hydrolase [Ruminococcus albus]|nr:alpha/beta hydrolase-fold protein [Ruminococcus albus]